MFFPAGVEAAALIVAFVVPWAARAAAGARATGRAVVMMDVFKVEISR